MELLQFCRHHQETTPCKECTINDEFAVGHLKMLCIQCFPVVDTCPDVVGTLIFCLIEVSGSVDDLILKMFKSINVSFIGRRQGVQYLDLSSKKALFHENIQDLCNIGFDVVAPNLKSSIDETYRCWLGLFGGTASIIKTNWKFCDLLSHSIHFWFDYTNNKDHIIHTIKRNARILI
jgi:hypothetical protein